MRPLGVSYSPPRPVTGRRVPGLRQRDQANGFRVGTQPTMPLDHSASLAVLDALKAADVDDPIRSAATTIYQARRIGQ